MSLTNGIARSAAAIAVRSNVCRYCSKPQQLRNFSKPALRYTRPATAYRISNQPIRWHSAPASSSQVYDFGQIKEFTEKPSSDRVLIDVREPSEYEAGYIPTAINIPIKSQPDAMFLPADEFEDRFGFEKPSADKEVVFYCKSGVRSSAAANLAQQIGYKKIGEYRGSWLDWEKNVGKSGK